MTTLFIDGAAEREIESLRARVTELERTLEGALRVIRIQSVVLEKMDAERADLKSTLAATARTVAELRAECARLRSELLAERQRGDAYVESTAQRQD